MAINTGVNALARELGVSSAAISYHKKRGLADSQIREKMQTRVARGGKQKGPARKREWEGKAYVPKRVKKGVGAVGTAPVGPSRPVGPPLPPPPPPGSDPDEMLVGSNGQAENFSQAQLRKEIALADQRELEVQIRRKEVLPIGPINAWFAGCIHKARDILMRIGPELQDRIGVEAATLVDKEIRRALEQLKEYEGE